jgi:hypothetical protein
MTRFERPAHFDNGFPYASAPPRAPTIRILGLAAVLLVCAVGLVVLYPIVANSVAKSVSEGNDPALLQFVGP